MIVVYQIAISAYRLAIQIASLFSSKAKQWIAGRRNWEATMKKELAFLTQAPLWIHVSSVGEYEQGKPILEAFKIQYPYIPIVLTFFSPSGYELLKNDTQADFVFYLPLDGRQAAKRFISIVNPAHAIFIKYEFWYFYFQELNRKKIPFVLISAKLRAKQFFFQWYGRSYQQVLRYPNHYFVQDEETKNLLKGIGLNNISIAGDTRVDRVAQIAEENEGDEIVRSHVGDRPALILGSAWKAELNALVQLLGTDLWKDWKIIIAPHEIDAKKIDALEAQLPVLSLRYTLQLDGKISEDVPVLIIDCVGRLKHIYRYCRLALIGGGFGDGIHNILEPAVFGIPSIFGPKHLKFPEAAILKERGGGFEFSSAEEFAELFHNLASTPGALDKASAACKAFIHENEGATESIMDKLGEVLHVK